MRTQHEHIRYTRTRLPGVEAMAASTARSFARHTHDQYGVGVIDDGAHASCSDRRQVEAGPGQLIFVNPGEVHDGHAVGGMPRRWRMLYLDPACVEALRADVRGGGMQPLAFVSAVRAVPSPHLRACFERVFAAASASVAEDALAGETALLELVAALDAQATEAASRREAVAGIERARACIDDDPARPVALAELGALAGLGRYRLLRGFVAATGLTPHAYLMQRRVALARRLLAAGRTPAEAAFEAGFCDQSHLTRCFTRQFGVGPARYAAMRD